MYKNLSDFISKTKVAIANGKAVIQVEPNVTLIGFSTEADKSDFEVWEEGYEYYLKLIEELTK